MTVFNSYNDKTNMKKIFKILFLFLLLLSTGQCIGQTSLTGIVVDKDGKPLKGVSYRLVGYGNIQNHARFSGGIIGSPPKTDTDGRFTQQIPSGNLFANLQFDSAELAPVVLDDIKCDGSLLLIVMTEGMLIEGTLSGWVNGKLVPIGGATISLKMFQMEFSFRKEQRTDKDGKFRFRISEPPKGRQWTLDYAGEHFVVEYKPKKKALIEWIANKERTVNLLPADEPAGTQ